MLGRWHGQRGPGGALLALAAILLLSAFLNLYHLGQIGRNGLGNYYYAATVKSMLTSPRLFFYLSFDPAGFLAVDKPPLALWLQALSAGLFGLDGGSLLLPQAIAGIASVYTLYRLVRRSHGEWAGLLAALVLAVTPISVVTNRNNTADSLLVLTLLLAIWAITGAIEDKDQRKLWIGAALIGVAFNLKMLQLVLALPALALCYLYGPRLRWRQFANLALGALALALLWPLAVELTPPDQRPYIGGTDTNSIFELIVDYNGVQRLWGEDWRGEVGTPGPLRLFGIELGGQVSWLLPFALVGLVAALEDARRKKESGTRQRRMLMLWVTWAVVHAVYFSTSTFFHRYYLVMLAPAIAALAGIGGAALWHMWKADSWCGWLAILAFPVTVLVQVLLLQPYPDWRNRLMPLTLILCMGTGAVLLLARRQPQSRLRWWAMPAFVVGILALLVTPTVWTLIPVTTCVNPTLPAGGPQPQPCTPFEPEQPLLQPELTDYLLAHRNGARFLAATYDLGVAEFGILATGEPFMAVGGYRGSDPILTVEEFVGRVAGGEVFFWVELTTEFERYPQQEAIRTWVVNHCPPVSLDLSSLEVRGPCVP